MIGDIVGRPGRRAVRRLLPQLVAGQSVDFVMANCENAAGGFGLSRGSAEELRGYGIEAMTMGNHVWGNKEIYQFIDESPHLVRPVNFPEGAPGRGETTVQLGNGDLVGVVNVCGTTFMEPLGCPFRSALAAVRRLREVASMIVVDVHAEATSEKMALGRYLDGKVSAVIGTHTHVQTADERILPKGTAYLTDVGMTGPIDSILGMKCSLVLQKFLSRMPARFEVATGPAILSAVIIDVEPNTGKATKIQRFQIKEETEEMMEP